MFETDDSMSILCSFDIDSKAFLNANLGILFSN